MQPSERSAPTSVSTFPRVVEPATPSERLAEYFAARGAELVAHVREHGAVLFRGFGELDVEHFDMAMHALAPSMRPMGDYFLAEDGRERVVGTRHCRATNAFKSTGGYLRQEVVAHSENYYCADVPEFVAFFCEAAPPAGHGGETGLFCGVRALAALPPQLRAKLESQLFLARVMRTRAELATECALSSTASLTELAAAARVRGAAACSPVVGCPEMVELLLRKPTVIAGPAGAGRRAMRALALNASELGSHGLAALARELERTVYTAERGWAPRRLLWRAARAFGPLARALELVESLPIALCAPLSWLRYGWRQRARARAAASAATACAGGDECTLRASLRLHEAECIGAALGRSVSLFEWRAGDVLLVDNLTVMHDGMPGSPWSPRTLHAVLCNPLRIARGAPEEDRAAATRVGHAAGSRQPGVLHVI
jgi:alpha-ketoglutarate-dependent taurine dioxygenase